jgi:hypothetical protein
MGDDPDIDWDHLCLPFICGKMRVHQTVLSDFGQPDPPRSILSTEIALGIRLTLLFSDATPPSEWRRDCKQNHLVHFHCSLLQRLIHVDGLADNGIGAD